MMPPLKNIVNTAMPMKTARPFRCFFDRAYANIVVSTIEMAVATVV